MKKNILHLLPSNSFSGAENVVCTIIENDDKYNMYYCCPKGPIENILKERNIKYIPIKKLTPHLVKKICIENNIDILHAHDFKASFISALSGFKGKIISHIHCNWAFISNWNIYTLLYNSVINKFAKIIVVSQETSDKAVFLKNHNEKFKVITNVVDQKRAIKKSKEFETKKYDLIFVGRINENKQPNIVIEITKKLKENFPNIKTCIIGKGDLENECKSLIEKYKLQKNVDMLGFKENPFPYVKNSKVAILPSKAEGLPMSVIECMILDVPVLNSGVGGLKTLFKDNKEFICNDIDTYYTRIKQIINGDTSYSKKCKKIIKNATDMNYYIKQINDVYKEIEN